MVSSCHSCNFVIDGLRFFSLLVLKSFFFSEKHCRHGFGPILAPAHASSIVGWHGQAPVHARWMLVVTCCYCIKMPVATGVIELPICGGIKQCKCIVILPDFPY